MKKLFIVLVTIGLFTALMAQGSEQESTKYLFKWGQNEVGGYLGLGGRYSMVKKDPAGYLDVKAMLIFNHNWAVGVSASGLMYDKKLNEIVSDGTYHLGAGYVSFNIEKYFNVTDDLSITVGLALGQGICKYSYDKDFRKNKVWYLETIDQTTFNVTEPSFSIDWRLSEHWSVGANAGFRFTSPVEMIQTDENILRGFSTGIAAKWGIF